MLGGIILISLKDIVKAKQLIAPYIQETSLAKVEYLSIKSGMNVFLKLENMQNTGSFKIRGALNKMAKLSDSEKEKGVIAASAGNHAQGLARSAQIFNVKATIVMPTTTPVSKIKATRDYGAEVILAGDNYDGAYQRALEIQTERDLTFVHPFDDECIIAGQGTIGLEIMNQLRHIDAVIVPIGGGGLISGVAKAVKSLNPNVIIIGVETINAASVRVSLDNNKLTEIKCDPTIAEGIAVGKPGKLTLELIKTYVDEVITVEEDEIASAILSLLEKQKIVVEGSGAASVAAILSPKLNYLKGKNVVCIISGGNIDVNMIESIINSGLMKDGRRFNLNLKLKHKTGELQKLLKEISNQGGNVLTIEQSPYDQQLGISEQKVQLVIEAFDEEHKGQIIEALKNNGYIR